MLHRLGSAVCTAAHIQRETDCGCAFGAERLIAIKMPANGQRILLWLGGKGGYCPMSTPILEMRWSRPSAEMHRASGSRRVHADPPQRNHVLAALPADEYDHLRPELEPIDLLADSTLYDTGEHERHLYFLTAGLVARVYVTESGASTQFALTGREGVIGVASFLGGDSTPARAVVLDAGRAYRLRAGLLKKEFRRGSALAHLLLRYVHALIAQTGQNAVCNQHHSLEQRLCRWILSCLDLLGSNELRMTHERVADMLGVRREGVTEVIGRLQRAGLVDCSRGHIVSLNRRELEVRACECYAVLKHDYDRLLPHAPPGAVCPITRFPLPLLA